MLLLMALAKELLLHLVKTMLVLLLKTLLMVIFAASPFLAVSCNILCLEFKAASTLLTFKLNLWLILELSLVKSLNQ